MKKILASTVVLFFLMICAPYAHNHTASTEGTGSFKADNVPMLKNASVDKRLLWLVMNNNADYYANPNEVPSADTISIYHPGIEKFGGFTNFGNGVIQSNIVKSPNGQISVKQLVTEPNRIFEEPHRHTGYDLFQYIEEGAELVRYGDHLEHTIVAVQGDTIFIPEGVCHQAYNASSVDLNRSLDFKIIKKGVKETRIEPCAEKEATPLTETAKLPKSSW